MVLSTTSHAVPESVGLAAAAGGVITTSLNEPVQPLHEVISVECEDKVTMEKRHDCAIVFRLEKLAS
jgi:hypothetical protein